MEIQRDDTQAPLASGTTGKCESRACRDYSCRHFLYLRMGTLVGIPTCQLPSKVFWFVMAVLSFREVTRDGLRLVVIQFLAVVALTLAFTAASFPSVVAKLPLCVFGAGLLAVLAFHIHALDCSA